MNRYLKFMAVGMFFSIVEEFLSAGLMKGPGDFIACLVIVWPVFLTFVYFSSRVLDRFFRDDLSRELAHYLVYGVIGLMFEWFVMQLAPWSKPPADVGMLLLGIVFQLGMLSFWQTVAFTPRLFLNQDELSRRTAKRILRFYVPFFIVEYVVAFSVSKEWRPLAVFPPILFAYLVTNAMIVNYFGQALRNRKPTMLESVI